MTILQDLRYALRGFARSPALVTAAVVCLALGIGANATIFGVVDTLLLRPPPYVEDPGRVVRLYFGASSSVSGERWTSSTTGYPVYRRLRDSMGAFDALAALSHRQSASLGRGAGSRRVDLVLASASYFPLLGVRPALGRFYAPDEDRPGGPQVVVLGYGLWRAAFGADSAIIGRPVHLGRSSYTVVGVAPERFTGVDLENVDVWAPLTSATPELIGAAYMNEGSYFLRVIGRLGPRGARPAEREATIAFRAEERYSRGDSTAAAIFGPVHWARGPEMSQDAKVSTWLAAVSVIVLLVACANVANLLLARSLQRRRDVAIRLALGAGRWRLARQLLTESILLACAGGLAAVLVTMWTGPLIRTFLLPDVPALAAAVDGRVLAFTGAIALLTGFLAGAAPAWQVGRRDLTPALKAGAGEGRYQRSRLPAGLLVGQVALTVVLVGGAGLFARSLRNVQGQDFGFDPLRTLVATVDLRAAGYRAAEINALYLRMLERVQALPGVEAAAASVGNAFGFWPGERAIGKCFIRSDGRCYDVIGVVPDARRFRAVEDAAALFYTPFTGDSTSVITAIVLRSRGRPVDLVAPVRRAMQDAVATLPFAEVTPVADLLAPSIRPWWLGTTMFGAFALLALVLSAVGLYGVLSYTVAQRTSEMGVRVAMGAQRRDVVRLMVGHGVGITALGAGVGALAAIGGGRVLSSLMYGVSPRDPLVLLAAALLPVVVAAIASSVPAWRASRVDPVIALRTE